MNNGLSFDIAHLLAGGLVLISFMLLYYEEPAPDLVSVAEKRLGQLKLGGILPSLLQAV